VRSTSEASMRSSRSFAPAHSWSTPRAVARSDPVGQRCEEAFDWVAVKDAASQYRNGTVLATSAVAAGSRYSADRSRQSASRAHCRAPRPIGPRHSSAAAQYRSRPGTSTNRPCGARDAVPSKFRHGDRMPESAVRTKHARSRRRAQGVTRWAY
jgi:hypothetical protein